MVLIIGSVSCTKKYSNPKVGEIYVLKEHSIYTTWQITEIKKNLIFYIPNDYQVSEKHLADSINQPNNYTDTAVSISKKEFKTKQNLYLIKPN